MQLAVVVVAGWLGTSNRAFGGETGSAVSSRWTVATTVDGIRVIGRWMRQGWGKQEAEENRAFGRLGS